MHEPLSWDGPLPRHLAVILDGNGRWATARGLPRVEGHRQGAESVRQLVRTARRLGIEALTLYAFSAQNWHRPSDEVMALMQLLRDYTAGEREEIMDNGIQFRCVGTLDMLPKVVRKDVDALTELSAANTSMRLSLAVSYGGREDIIRAARTLAGLCQAQDLQPQQIDAERFTSVLSTHGLPQDVDLVIRTGGEKRISNFLLWEIAYAEFWFTDVLWPDFSSEHLFSALEEFGQRQRRFGRLSGD
jgi:undecaprenyl diphosphate synthase